MGNLWKRSQILFTHVEYVHTLNSLTLLVSLSVSLLFTGRFAFLRRLLGRLLSLLLLLGLIILLSGSWLWLGSICFLTCFFHDLFKVDLLIIIIIRVRRQVH